MALKNKIKVDSFIVDKVRTTDITQILRLAVLAQSSFGITDKSAPTVFLYENSNLIRRNMDFSFVFRNRIGNVFAAFIIEPQTTVSAELKLVLTDPDVLHTKLLYDEVYKSLDSTGFKMFFVKVYKKRKKIDAYLKYLKIYGFNETLEENDEFVTVCRKKS